MHCKLSAVNFFQLQETPKYYTFRIVQSLYRSTVLQKDTFLARKYFLMLSSPVNVTQTDWSSYCPSSKPAAQHIIVRRLALSW